ncbi:META domain-containing protein [Castellaniella sp.]|uniref:META domain-containing protein n=1 Tax=Castellaniella sp. TaxID=1955812 RepID=UPI002AFF79BE|nr:META domain-containing protein [Castellaniella sp.]
MKKILVVSALSLLLGACAQIAPVSSSAPGTAVMTSPSLNATTLSAYHWYLVKAEDARGRDIPALQTGVNAALYLAFSDQSISVRGGCNTQFGGYVLKAGALQLKGLASTMMACDSALMELDQAVALHLKGDLAAGLLGDARTPVLVLTTAGGDVLTLEGKPASVK